MNYNEILSGRRKGLIYTLLRCILYPPSQLYMLVITIRNALYSIGILSSYKCDVPVICVGNITAGGTGKTPMVVWLCKYLCGKGARVALLSRGYKSDSKIGLNDEMRLLSDALPEVRFYIGSNRSESAQKAVADGATILVLDDGYQHLRLSRDLNILMVDALCPFGYGRMLPAGLLREPISQISRAGIAVVSRADLIDLPKIDEVKRNILSVKEMPIVLASHKPSILFSSDGITLELKELSGRKVVAFCSIGNPAGFIATLEKLGANVCGKYFFDDHSEYDSERVSIIAQLIEDMPECWLVTTEKDWVKLRELPDIAGLARLFWLKVEMSFLAGEAEIKKLVDNIANLN